MNHKKTFIGALAAFPLLAIGQTNLSFQDNKTFTQVGPREFRFDGGEFALEMTDGSFVLSACGGFINDDGDFIESSIFADFIRPSIGCSLGTTGFIAEGGLDEDGLRPQRGFISVAPVPIPFAEVAPARQGEILLNAAPIGELPRPIGGGGWVDDSTTIWYDYVNRPIRAFEFTRYNFSRPYGPTELNTMYRQVVPGPYQFFFPRNPEGLSIIDQQIPVTIAVNHLKMLEAFPGRSLLAGSDLFYLTNDDDWNNGRLNVDPDVGFKFTWAGLSGSHILNGDTTTFSMVDPATDQVVFPAYPPETDENLRLPQLLDTPSTDFVLGVAFFEPGQVVTARLVFQRNLPSTTFSTDNSTRIFEWTVEFVQSYQGFLENTNFARTLTEIQRDPDFDFDGDGFTNLEEFALQTDPFNPASVPDLVTTIDPVSQKCEFEIPKRPNSGISLRYQVEVSSDLVNYRVILPGDDKFVIELDNEATYRVRSRDFGPAGPCFFRPRITLR